MNKQNIIISLRIIILVLLITFLYLFINSSKVDCDKCSFNIDNEELDYKEFMDIYYNKCLTDKSKENSIQLFDKGE